VTRAKPVTWALDRVDNRAGFQNSEGKSYSSCLREREREKERKNNENSGSFMKNFSFAIKKTSL